MTYDLKDLQGDIAEVQHDRAGFGSGRLVATNLLLTAAHILWKKDAKTGLELEDWQIRFERDKRDKEWPFRLGNRVVWHDRDRDLAVIEIAAPKDAALVPKLKLQVAKVTTNDPHSVQAVGYPRAAKQSGGPREATAAIGDLIGVDADKPLRFGVESAFLPNLPHADWPGMSGSAVFLRASPDSRTIWIYGVIRDVPANFDRQLRVARLADAWEDKDFRQLLTTAGTEDKPAADPITEIADAWRSHLREHRTLMLADAEAVCRGLKPIDSPLRHRFSSFVGDAPWNERIRDAVRHIVAAYEKPDQATPDDDVAASLTDFLKAIPQIFAETNFLGNYADISAQLNRAVESLIQSAGSQKRALIDRSESPRGRRHGARILDTLHSELRHFREEWLVQTSFARCFVVLGSFGSGRTYLTRSIVEEVLEKPPLASSPWVIFLDAPVLDVSAGSWILQSLQAVSRRKWSSLDEIDQYMSGLHQRIVFVIDDFDRMARERPSSARSLRDFIIANTRMVSFYWVFLALDTSYDILGDYLEFFAKYGVGSKHLRESSGDLPLNSYFADGAYMVDSLNRQEELGLQLVRKNLDAHEGWDETLTNLDDGTRTRLSSPLIASVLIGVQRKTGSVPSLHFIDFIEKLWALRATNRPTSVSLDQIRDIMRAVCRVILRERTARPSVSAVKAEIKMQASVDGQEALEVLAQLSFVELPRSRAVGVEAAECLDLRFDILWHNLIAEIMVQELHTKTQRTVDERVGEWLAGMPDAWFCQGVWQLFLLHGDRRAPWVGAKNPDVFNWWEFTLRGLTARSGRSGAAAGIVPPEAAFFASPHASPGVANYLCRRLLSLEEVAEDRRQVFAIVYCVFSAPEVRLTDRCKLAARYAFQIKVHTFENYLLFQLARTAEAEEDAEALFAGLRFLSGIEILSVCEKIVRDLWERIITLHEEGHQSDREGLSRLCGDMLRYLGNEAQNASEEYRRVGRSKPRGLPYFVREHVIQSFCDYVLDCENDALAAFDRLRRQSWYEGARMGLDSRISSEMRREANLAFGRWYRRSKQRGHRLAADSYVTLLHSLIDEATSGRRQSGETAFFLLRHSSVPHDLSSEDERVHLRGAVIDSGFAEVYDKLKSCSGLDQLFTRYPIAVRARDET